jgi:electron transfer flavoprotein beta subunit
MKVVVCVKQIPDPALPGELDPATNLLKRDDKLILDESDSYGVEMALQLVEAAGGGQVSLVSMAPICEMSGLRTALAMGADDAILVSDGALAGTDALGTAKVLAAAESSDGYTGTVPEMIAGVLDIPSITFAKQISVADGTVNVQRQTELGYDDVECGLPALVSVTAGVVEPRYPSFKGIMAAKKKPVEELDLAGVGVDASAVGQGGARQETVNVVAAEEREAGEIVEDEGDAHLKIVELLDQLKVI